MSSYPTINYIGNKQKVSKWIVECLPTNVKTILDLFSGGCSVSYELKQSGYRVISNDVLYSNYVLAKAIIENSKTLLCEKDFINFDTITNRSLDKCKLDTNFLKDNIYFDYEVDELSKLIANSNDLTGYKKYIYLSLIRRSMVRKIPYSRLNVKWEEIQKFRDEEYSYRKYGRCRHYHNIPFIEHIKLNLEEYNNAIFSNNKKKRCIK